MPAGRWQQLCTFTDYFTNQHRFHLFSTFNQSVEAAIQVFWREKNFKQFYQMLQKKWRWERWEELVCFSFCQLCGKLCPPQFLYYLHNIHRNVLALKEVFGSLKLCSYKSFMCCAMAQVPLSSKGISKTEIWSFQNVFKH